MIKNEAILRTWFSAKTILEQLKKTFIGKSRKSPVYISQSTPVLPNAKQTFGPFWLVVHADSWGWTIENAFSDEPKTAAAGRVIIKYDPVDFKLLKELVPTWEGLE